MFGTHRHSGNGRAEDGPGRFEDVGLRGREAGCAFDGPHFRVHRLRHWRFFGRRFEVRAEDDHHADATGVLRRDQRSVEYLLKRVVLVVVPHLDVLAVSFVLAPQEELDGRRRDVVGAARRFRGQGGRHSRVAAGNRGRRGLGAGVGPPAVAASRVLPCSLQLGKRAAMRCRRVRSVVADPVLPARICHLHLGGLARELVAPTRQQAVEDLMVLAVDAVRHRIAVGAYDLEGAGKLPASGDVGGAHLCNRVVARNQALHMEGDVGNVVDADRLFLRRERRAGGSVPPPGEGQGLIDFEQEVGDGIPYQARRVVSRIGRVGVVDGGDGLSERQGAVRLDREDSAPGVPRHVAGRALGGIAPSGSRRRDALHTEGAVARIDPCRAGEGAHAVDPAHDLLCARPSPRSVAWHSDGDRQQAGGGVPIGGADNLGYGCRAAGQHDAFGGVAAVERDGLICTAAVCCTNQLVAVVTGGIDRRQHLGALNRRTVAPDVEYGGAGVSCNNRCLCNVLVK